MKNSNTESASHTVVKLPTNRKFGLFFSSLLFLCCIFFTYIGEFYVSIPIFLSVILLFCVTIFHDKLLTPFNKLWTKFGLFLGRIISPIILGLIFFGIFTTVSIILKLIGRDELRLKSYDQKSFWKKSNKEDKNSYNFRQQF